MTGLEKGWFDMAGTSDGISEMDWDGVREICTQIIDAIDANDDIMEATKKASLFEYLAHLERKYGERPSILATMADFVDDEKAKIVLLQRAFEIAKTNSDYHNLTLVSSSLAQAYIEEIDDNREGRKWLNELEKCLRMHWDSGEAGELQRLRDLVGE